MKCFAVLLIVLLLGGCAVQQDPSEPEVPATPEEPSGFYDPDSTAEAETFGALRCYSFGSLSCREILPVSDGLLLFFDTTDGCTVTKVTGEECIPVQTLMLPFSISEQNASVQATNSGFSCYDPKNRCVMQISEALEILETVAAPADLVGTPILSRDESQLYYTTASGIRVLDLSTNISRLIHHNQEAQLQLIGLILEDSVLHCQTTGGSHLFLSTQSGNILHRYPETVSAATCDSNYFVQLRHGSIPLLVFGNTSGTPQTLTFPQSGTMGYFLPELNCAVGVQQQGTAAHIDLYDLSTGLRRGSVTAEKIAPTKFAASSEGSIWFLSSVEERCNLYLWNPERSLLRDSQVYTAPYQSQEPADSKLAETCQQITQRLSETYSIDIRLYSQQMSLGSSYRLTQEYQSAVVLRELRELEAFLQSCPSEFWQQLSQRFDGFTICLVRSFVPPDSAPPDDICCALYWDGYHPHILLSSESDSQKVLAHSLCHLIDTVVINGSSAYDTWDQLNPTGFRYDYDYTANANRNSTAYLMDSKRYFVDMFSMSFPKEDRARILEFAMTQGNTAVFQTDTMQAKLSRICIGIREAFKLKKWPEALPWEQYLMETSLP